MLVAPLPLMFSHLILSPSLYVSFSFPRTAVSRCVDQRLGELLASVARLKRRNGTCTDA